MKTPPLFVAILLSVTILLHLPHAQAAPELTINPAKIYTGETFRLTYIANDSGPHVANFTLYYGGAELNAWTVRFNKSYETAMSIPVYECEGHPCFGWYTVRMDLDDEPYPLWASLEYVWSYGEIAADQRRQTDLVTQSNNGLKNAFVLAEGSAIAITIFLMLALVFWGQHKYARKYRRISWVKVIWLWLVRIFHIHPAAFNQWTAKAKRLTEAFDGLFETIKDNDCARWKDIKIAQAAVVWANTMIAIGQEHKQGVFAAAKASLDAKDSPPSEPPADNPSMKELSPIMEKASKPPDETPQKTIPRKGMRLVGDIPEEERE